MTPVFGGIYNNSAVTYEYEEGEHQTVILDVPMYTKNVDATVGTLTPKDSGYYLVFMNADAKQTAGSEGAWQIELDVNDSPEGYYTQTVTAPVGQTDKLAKTGIVQIAAGSTLSLKAFSNDPTSRLEIDDAHLSLVKIADSDPVCNCGCNCK
jgi:hypothetical protein